RSLYPLHYSDAFSAAHDAEIVERARATAALRSTAEGRAGQLAAVQARRKRAHVPRRRRRRPEPLRRHGEAAGLGERRVIGMVRPARPTSARRRRR
ncbi:MAG TPA: hypothetical protein VET66_05575, partial [Steroidobacteraceae bacterium]|nr:hypothetical protein [Steroidobacteraceae bacterium]